ncbi:inactive protein RESTRICTED TEV MOVEMENT 2 [Cucumis sativus]|uniref:SHSP domain-containing protein n=1 Tax=Cucumis sativus TaxID=3659 RepID=A0A0A0KTC3_CUCSA|nr:inactive protein RESTRICTED TEV MOVEMENT 2 [Cucumis sativus]KGN52154.1 hypothetical protein Csa_007997 [Cucumis sativus]
MAARPRITGLGAVRRQSVRAYNDTFTPNVEEIDENEAHILRLQLPGFSHVNVNVEKEARTVVVTGDRNVSTTRLQILDKTFPVPQNSKIDEIKHELQDGVLTITIPKQTTEPVTAPPLQAAESTAPPDTKAETKEPDVAALTKSDSTSDKAKEEISSANVSPPETKAETKEPEEGPPEGDSTPEKGLIDLSLGNVAPPKTKAEVEEPEVAALPKEGISEELQKQGSAKATKEEAPTPAPLVAPQPPVATDYVKEETTMDQNISSQEQKKEIGNENPENGKESKTEEVRKNEETTENGTGTPSPRATKVGKLVGCFKIRRLPLRTTVSLSATVAVAVAAYFAYAYYGVSFAME